MAEVHAEIPDVLLPLPLFASARMGALRNRDGEEFAIYIGASEDVVRQLKEKSLDERDVEIQKNTSDRQRFGEGSYEEWYAKERSPFALIDVKNGKLAAFAWFGPKPLGRKSLKHLPPEELAKEGSQPDTGWHTIVYRSYDPYRGKGLMTPFLKFALETYEHFYPSVKLWAGIDGSNAASEALATKLGFSKRDDLVDEKGNWFAMVKEN